MYPVLKYLLLLVNLWISFPMVSSVVDTIEVRSRKMSRNIPCVVISPDKQISGTSCPVLYLLHGYGGNHKSWLEVKPELPQFAEQY